MTPWAIMRTFSQRGLVHLFSVKRLPSAKKCLVHTTPACSHLYRDVDTAVLKNRQISCQPLPNRGVVRIAGEHAGVLLQGLITNDMTCLEKTCDIKSLYAFMLNVQGRIVNDLIVYKTSQGNDGVSFFVECDSETLPDFIKTLKKYKLRKKVDITDVSKENKVWAAFDKTVPTSPPEITVTSAESVTAFCPDPRLKLLGHRLLLAEGVTGSSVLKGAEDCLDNNHDHYLDMRYQLGIGEGITDLPPGSALPLESNLAFLNGVSFQKGCYIGQELTARTHHTGVIRKRLMPITVTGSSSSTQTGDSLTNTKGKSCGKLRGVHNNHGLALLRVQDVINKNPLTIQRKNKDDAPVAIATAEASVPSWWPVESDEIIKSALQK